MRSKGCLAWRYDGDKCEEKWCNAIWCDLNPNYKDAFLTGAVARGGYKK